MNPLYAPETSMGAGLGWVSYWAWARGWKYPMEWRAVMYRLENFDKVQSLLNQTGDSFLSRSRKGEFSVE